MREYKILDQQEFISGDFSIVPVRSEDRYDIMNWRNEQMYHLRQNEPLTREKQDVYFDSVITDLFEQDKPAQVLFSFLEGGKCIGYGGLVHINWLDKNAEISLIMDTRLEEVFFESYWIHFLSLIEEVAFRHLRLHKIFTYAFDLRPRLYKALEKRGFENEARLKEQSSHQREFIDVVIHSKWNK